MEDLKNEIIQMEALDIEDLVRIGRDIGGCPYYVSRSMMPAADLVVLPYQSLLSKSSRESLDLNIKDSIIIIDEAHNLADTLISMYDAKITVPQVNISSAFFWHRLLELTEKLSIVLLMIIFL